MLRPPPFPIDIDALTADVLAEGIGAEVVGFTAERIGADRGMLGEIFLLNVSYAPGEQGPKRVVAKFAALREESLAAALRGRPHERELRCFDELLVDTPVATPTNYGTWYDPATAHFLLLQGAVDVDIEVDQVVGLSPSDAQLVVKEMARLHGRWWNDQRLVGLEWLPRLDGAGRVANLTTLSTLGWKPLCELLGGELSAPEQAIGEQLPERLVDTLRSLASLPATLIHGDMRADNLLFSPDHDQVTLIDWQGCGLGPPSFDLAYFISQSLSVDTRRDIEDDLLDLYRSEVRDAGFDIPAEQVQVGYAESMVYGLAVACAIPVIGDVTQPRVKSLASTVGRRSLVALADHGQL